MRYNEVDFEALGAMVSGLPKPITLAFRGNLGDALIRAGQLEIERNAGVSNAQVSHLGRRPCSIIVPGGGNLVEGYYTTAARELGSLQRDTPGVVMPHTVRGFYFPLRRHPRLTIVCRETSSYDRLVRNGIEPRRLRLGHDTAFALAGSELVSSALASVSHRRGTLVALRSDGESSGLHPVGSDLRCTSFDVTGSASGFWVDPAATYTAASSVLSFISSFEHVITDRLHVAVAADLLSVPCWLMANEYDKNRSVYERSMRGGTVRFVSHLEEVPAEVAAASDGEDSRTRWKNHEIASDALNRSEKARRVVAKARRRLHSAVPGHRS